MTKGGITTEQHLAKIGAKLSDEQKELAQTLATTAPDVVKYAFRLLGQVTLSKRDQRVYKEMVESAGQDAADAWRKLRLAKLAEKPADEKPS